tara:strand:+ start:545 stop:736 length:192 start_codon:yes stop_codon:yes gene_type:complete
MMKPVDAVMIAEGVIPSTQEELIQAWQMLVDTGMAWKLQGWFGRTAAQLIEEGFVNPPGDCNG